MRKNSKALVAIVALVVVAVFLTATTLAALSTNKNLSSYGSITVTAQLGVYSDSACTIPLSTVNWGSLSPGGSTTKTLIKNTSAGAPLTSVNVTSTGARQAL
jgi:predicted neutral ceramidase superfamily lipid hydrolase